jgi:type II secretory pathway component PulJ
MSLPELLVAMACAALVGFMAFELLRGENGHYTRTRGKIRVQSDVRDAMEILEEDMANAGYRCGVATQGTVSGTPATAAAPIPVSLPLDPATSPAVQVTDGSQSDVVAYRYFEQANSALGGPLGYPDPTRLNVIQYQLNGTNLTRTWQVVNTVTGASSTPATSVVLSNVVTFQAQIGTDTTVDDISRNVTDTVFRRVGGGFDLTTVSGVSTATATTATPANSDTFTFAGWTAGSPLTINGAQRFYAANAIYRLGIDLQPNANFMAWLDTTSARRSTNWIRLGLVDATGAWIPGDSVGISFLPVADGPTRIDWSFRTASAVRGYLALQVELDPQTPQASTAQLKVQNLRLYRVRNANQTLAVGNAPNPNWVWHNGDSGSVPLRRQTLALRLWILAKSARANREMAQPRFTEIGNWNRAGFTPSDSNTYVLQERVLPVVNR